MKGGWGHWGGGPLDRAAAGLHPAYFSLVMATGIVSLAAWVQGFAAIARAMLWLNVAFFAALWGLTLLRLMLHPVRLIADLHDHTRGVGFFTTVAASCVLGSQALLIQDAPGAAWGLWVVGAVLWVVLTYTIFTALTVKSVKPSLADGITGGWLLSVVATQSVSVLATHLAGGAGTFEPGHPMGGAHREGLLLVALLFWLGGAMLYVWIISLIFYRYAFFPFRPSDLAPPYWINMGAMAISTLAGATLVLAGRESPLVRDLLPFIKGATLLFWATATWWIPMLLILGVWRHVVQKFPLRYDPLYWGAVFPLGMYSVATARMAGLGDPGAAEGWVPGAMDLPLLRDLPAAFFFASLAAWALALAGMVHHVVTSGGRAPRA